MKTKLPKIPFTSFLFLIIITSEIINACNETPPEEEKKFKITGISIPGTIYTSPGESIEITAKGFEENDLINLVSTTNAEQDYLLGIDSLGSNAIKFQLPQSVISDTYRIIAVRGDETQILGTTQLNITTGILIPDKPGMTIKGQVYCNGAGVPNVSVSDGYEVTQTNEDGIYYLPSNKEKGYVFISVPENYEVDCDNNLPLFFKRLTGSSSVEQKDFSLFETNNSKYVLLLLADWHLADRNSDLQQFSKGFLQDVNAMIDHYTSEGTKVYGLTLGDLSWDIFWYSNKFALPEYIKEMNKVNCDIFNAIGNHDHDPYVANNDWLSGMPYIEHVCPNYYSFNLGKIHYVILDDINYINTGGSQGVIGNRNYTAFIDNDQLAWLEKDLDLIEDKNTPIVIAFHIPLYKQPVIKDDGTYDLKLRMDNGAELLAILEEFNHVHILSGHVHNNYTVEVNPSLMEHNIAAVCATWWWTGTPGYADNHICRDGSPGGYGVWEVDETHIEWYYKSTGYERNYQFRTYDLNSIHMTAAKYAPNCSDDELLPYVGDYANASTANEVLINVWNFDTSWDIKVLENGVELDVKHVNAKDPLHLISYPLIRLKKGKKVNASFATKNAPHFFKVKASGPTTTLNITVTDGFGNTYSETMERPKELTYDMR